MTLVERFEDAQRRVKQLASAPPTETLLELYALFKQGSTGDVQGARPGMIDFKGRAKWDAWAKLKGQTKHQAMEAYIALVDSLAKKSPH